MKGVRRRVAGEPVHIGDIVVTPLAEFREITFGAAAGGFTMSRMRPKALEVREGSDPPRMVGIPDVGFWLRLVVLTAGVLLIIARRRDA